MLQDLEEKHEVEIKVREGVGRAGAVPHAHHSHLLYIEEDLGYIHMPDT